jgi:hypothetical protein
MVAGIVAARYTAINTNTHIFIKVLYSHQTTCRQEEIPEEGAALLRVSNPLPLQIAELRKPRVAYCTAKVTAIVGIGHASSWV